MRNRDLVFRVATCASEHQAMSDDNRGSAGAAFEDERDCAHQSARGIQ